MIKSILIGILLLIGITIPAQDTKDTLQSWMSTFYRLANPVLSENGKWAAVRKRYDIRQDTLVVVNTRKSNIPAATIVLDGTVSFLKDKGILVFGGGKAEFLNLKSGIKKRYDNVATAYPISERLQYGVLTKDSILSIYTVEGIRQHHLTGIQGQPLLDRDNNLYLCRKTGNTYEINIISGKEMRKLFTTRHSVKELEISPSGKQLILTGYKNETEKPQLSFINTKDGSFSSLSSGSSGKEDYFRVTEIQEGKAYFVALYTVHQPETGLVDIWYGNDDQLNTKMEGSKTGRYWLWKPESGKFEEFPQDVYPAIASLNSERYFLSYHPTKGHNFLTLEAQFNDTSIYDAEKRIYRKFTPLKGVTYDSPEVVCSKNGRLILGSEDGKKWTLFDLENNIRNVIDVTGLRNPVFSDDNRLIFFESENGLWRYDTVAKVTIRSEPKHAKAVSIIGITNYETTYNSHISIRTFDPKKPLKLEIKDRYASETSYYLLKGNVGKEIVHQTKNKIGSIVYDEKLESILTLEEHYNQPPHLYIIRGSQKRLLFDGGNADPLAPSLKQEIIHYTTADGRPLKGILYYPLQYKPHQKYPMVVHIYQIQSDKSNDYLIPSYNGRDGLDVRNLTASGYFVLLPDTAVGPLGAGLSALDCVNKALDAVSSNPNINMEKVGLVGHSFGGYETNFIATHSNRFAAYISGAGISDIVRSYFSYNYLYPGPYYWQFETGILRMPPFLNTKEVYYKNNPIFYVEKISAPILLWTGTKDQNVPWDQTTEFFIGLKRNEKPVIALFYPNGRHALAFNSQEKKDLYVKVMEWWNYFLKDKKNIPWIDKQMRKGAL